MKPRDIALLQATLGHRFQRVELLEQALTTAPRHVSLRPCRRPAVPAWATSTMGISG